MNKLNKYRIFTLNFLVITIFIICCFFIKDVSKPLLFLLFACTLAFFLYQDILKRLFMKCNSTLLNHCNSKEAAVLLSKLKKADILHLYRENLFILQCYLVLDNYDEGTFTSFINEFNRSKLQANKFCNITFHGTLLQYFFLKQSQDQFLSLYDKIKKQYAASNIAFTPYYEKLLSILEGALADPNPLHVRQLHNLLKEPHTKREEIYIALYSGFICAKRLHMKTEAEKYFLQASSVSQNFTITNIFKTVFLGEEHA